jgi:superfamily I DNA and/or RNA helicase
MHDESYTENGEKIDGLDYINESGSLLEYFDQKFDNHLLTYHYRSLKSELIEFSNIVFYDGKLVCANQLTSDNQVGIEVIETNGH